MKGGRAMETVCFDNEFDMAMYIGKLKRKKYGKFKISKIANVDGSIYVTISQLPERRAR